MISSGTLYAAQMGTDSSGFKVFKILISVEVKGLGQNISFTKRDSRDINDFFSIAFK
jgi:hypothetical protein